MVETPRTLLVALFMLASASAHAQWWDPAGQGLDAPPTDPSMGVPLVKDAWNDDVIRTRYKMDPGISAVNRVMEIVFNPPLDKLMNDFDDDLAQKIADGCKRTFPGDGWRQIRCASQAVDKILKSVDLDKFPRTFCRAHARGFKEVFERLEIPNSEVGPIMITGYPEGHVLNRITVRGSDGRYYAYAIDTGWDPDKVYPLTESTIRWHDRDGDGRTDFQELPPLPVERPAFDVSIFQPSNAAGFTGLNTPRFADTTGGVTAGTVSGARAAIGAGTHRD